MISRVGEFIKVIYTYLWSYMNQVSILFKGYPVNSIRVVPPNKGEKGFFSLSPYYIIYIEIGKDLFWHDSSMHPSDYNQSCTRLFYYTGQIKGIFYKDRCRRNPDKYRLDLFKTLAKLLLPEIFCLVIYNRSLYSTLLQISSKDTESQRW